MKFVLAYRMRPGASAAENVASAEAAQKLLTSWTPSASATIHQWVQRCDGNGGYSFIETDNPSDLYRDLAIWNPWLEFEVHPVIDIIETLPINTEVLAQAKAAF